MMSNLEKKMKLIVYANNSCHRKNMVMFQKLTIIMLMNISKKLQDPHNSYLAYVSS